MEQNNSACTSERRKGRAPSNEKYSSSVPISMLVHGGKQSKTHVGYDLTVSNPEYPYSEWCKKSPLLLSRRHYWSSGFHTGAVLRANKLPFRESVQVLLTQSRSSACAPCVNLTPRSSMQYGDVSPSSRTSGHVIHPTTKSTHAHTMVSRKK